jgi:hypothetical protein
MAEVVTSLSRIEFLLIVTPGLLLLAMIRSLKLLAPFSMVANCFVLFAFLAIMRAFRGGECVCACVCVCVCAYGVCVTPGLLLLAMIRSLKLLAPFSMVANCFVLFAFLAIMRAFPRMRDRETGQRSREKDKERVCVTPGLLLLAMLRSLKLKLLAPLRS